MLELERLPRTLTVIGGGVIGVEYATIFSALDVPVTLIEPRNTILDFVDREIVDDFIHQMRDRGMTIRLGSAVKEIAAERSWRQGELGRRPQDAAPRSCSTPPAASGNVAQPEPRRRRHRGRLARPASRSIRRPSRPARPNIYAAGDVIGFPEPGLDLDGAGPGRRLPRLRRAAAAGAGNLSLWHLRGAGDFHRRPVRGAGAREPAFPTRCGIARFRETSRGHIMGVNSGFLKLIFALDTRRLLGAHIVGEGATELIHIGQAVINLGGTVDFFVENTFNYPTLAEAYKIAGLDAWNRMGQG